MSIMSVWLPHALDQF